LPTNGMERSTYCNDNKFNLFFPQEISQILMKPNNINIVQPFQSPGHKSLSNTSEGPVAPLMSRSLDQVRVTPFTVMQGSPVDEYPTLHPQLSQYILQVIVGPMCLDAMTILFNNFNNLIKFLSTSASRRGAVYFQTRCGLLPDAEVSEDDVQDLLGADPARDAAQAAQGQPHALRRQRQVPIPVVLVLAQRRHALLQVGTVAGLGQAGGSDGQRVPTPAEPGGGVMGFTIVLLV